MFKQTQKMVERDLKSLEKEQCPDIVIFMIKEQLDKAKFFRERAKKQKGPIKKHAYDRSLNELSHCVNMIGSASRFLFLPGETKCQK